MKKIILLASCISMAIFSASAQNIITANSAIDHIGEQVCVADSVYNVKIYNDSTAVIDLGRKNDKTALNVVFHFCPKFMSHARILRSFKKSKIAVSGFVALVDSQPTIILTDLQNLRFLPKPFKQKWVAISWIPYQKEPK